MTENVSRKSLGYSPEEQRMQKLENQIWAVGMRLLGDKDIQSLSTPDPKYMQLYVAGENFMKELGVKNVDLAIYEMLNVTDKEISDEGIPILDHIEVVTLYRGHCPMKSISPPGEDDVYKPTEEELKDLLSILEQSKIKETAGNKKVFPWKYLMG